MCVYVAKVRKRFVKNVWVCDPMEGGWDQTGSVVEMWEVFRDGMVGAAETTLGW